MRKRHSERKNKPTTSRRLGLEYLESRQLLAANLLGFAPGAGDSIPAFIGPTNPAALESLATELRNVGTVQQLKQTVSSSNLDTAPSARPRPADLDPPRGSRPQGRPGGGFVGGESSQPPQTSFPPNNNALQPRVIRSRLGNISFGPAPIGALRITSELSDSLDRSVEVSQQTGSERSLPGEFFVDLRTRPPQAFYVAPEGSRPPVDLPPPPGFRGGLVAEGEGPAAAEPAADSDDVQESNTSNSETLANDNLAAPLDDVVNVRSDLTLRQVDTQSSVAFRTVQPIELPELRSVIRAQIELLSGQEDSVGEIKALRNLLGQLESFAGDAPDEQLRIESLKRLRSAIVSGRIAEQGFVLIDGLMSIDATDSPLGEEPQISPEVMQAIASAWNSPIGTALLEHWSEQDSENAGGNLLERSDESQLTGNRPYIATATAAVGISLLAYSKQKRRREQLDEEQRDL